mgnify:CR=1 FL=1
MNQRKFYAVRAKEIVKELRTRRGMSYEKLAAALNRQGWMMSRQVLINRLNRGTYSFAFALQLLAILGEEKLPIPKAPRADRGPSSE